MAFLTTINDAISTTTTPTSVSGETLANYGENTVTNTPLHAVTSVYRSPTLTAYTDYIVTLASNLINLNTTQADTLELVAPHAEAAGYWSFNINNSTNTIDDANGLNNGTLNPGADSIINETFNSTTYDTPVQLAHTALVADSVVVTTVDGGTTYTETTNYTIDYSAGTITTLSTGDMAENTNYYIDYNYSAPVWTNTDCQYGGCYEFDGTTNQYIQTSNMTVGTGSVTGWVKRDDASAIAGEIFFIGVKEELDYYIRSTAIGGIVVWINQTNTQDVDDGLLDLEWHFISTTFNGSVLNLYVDGIYKRNVEATSDSVTGTVRIGKSGFQPGFNGTIDEVRVYNRSLSAEEIKEQYDTYMNTSVYKADYTYEQSGYVEGTSSSLLWLIPTFLLLSLLVLFWRLADQGA